MRTMRKIAALAVTMVLAINQFVGVTSADEVNLPEQEELMLGDVTLNEVIDIKDLTCLARHVAMIETLEDYKARLNADVDQSEGVDIKDLTRLARYVAEIENYDTRATHTHNWLEVYDTVYHEEVGHYEEQSTTWEEKVYYTGYCLNTRPIISLYQILKENNMWSEDAWETLTVEKKYYDEENGYYDTYINVGAMRTWSEDAKNLFNKYVTDMEESTTFLKKYHIETIEHTDTKKVWVVDKNAYDETVVTGYKCSGCGATK